MAGESFAERLRRLRRDGGTPAGAPERESEPPVCSDEEDKKPEDWQVVRKQRARQKGAPDWLKRRQDKGTARRSRRDQDLGKPRTDGLPLTHHIKSLAMPHELGDRHNQHGPYGERILLRSDQDRHGDFTFDEVDHVEDLGWLTRDPAISGLDPRKCVYLDIETTGLGGGAGTWPFMVALGRYVDGQFELWQGFMRDPSEEAAVLWETARRIEASAGVVSFFGKSFDRHRLEDKMRVHSIEPPFDGRPHLDLYYPLNRLYTRRAGWDRLGSGLAPPAGGGFENGRLGTMERGLLGLTREDDLSGAHAPAAWFDYLGGRVHLLDQVFRHNALDVWSLATLVAHLGRSRAGLRADGSVLKGPGLARAIGLAGLARDAGERELECALLDGVRVALDKEREPSGLGLWTAHAQRLAGDKAAALKAYSELEERRDLNERHRAASAAERAKLLEHHRRDYRAALMACEVARAAAVRGGMGDKFLEQLGKRAGRLEAKLAKE